MTFPTVAEERLMAAGAPVPWKAFSILARCGFFLLAAICSAALYGFLYATTDSRTAAGIAAGILCLAAAEVLMRAYHLFNSGIEEGLWLGGGVALVLAIGSGDKGWIVLTAIALFAAGVRLLNPLFATAGALVLAFRFDSPQAAAYCALLAVAALAVHPLPRRRPSADRTIGALLVVMPLAAYLFAKDGKFTFDWRVAAALLTYAGAALVIGLRFRLHAPIVALFPTLGCFAWEVRELAGMRLETRLIVWGSALLAVSIAVERFLKTPRRGITSRQLGDDRLGDLLQLAGTIAIAHHEPPGEQGGPRIESGGSSFGGAGAGGEY